jgi:two-component system LytT family response regulator
VDDEPAGRRGVRLLLERQCGLEVVGEACDGESAIRLIRELRPSIVFLDIQMPGCDGFEVLRAFPRDERPVVVFVTAFDMHAVEAFEINAVDYLLKPFDDDRFYTALETAKHVWASRSTAGLNAKVDAVIARLGETEGEAPRADERITVKTAGEIYFLRPEEIDWIEAEGDYMKFHVGSQTHLMRETMSRLEARLDPRHFVRIHRSTIVNLDQVQKLSPSFVGEYTVVLRDGTKLKLSRGYQDRFKSLLTD